MANFLFIDTSASVATVAFSHEGDLLAKESISGQFRQAGELNIMIERVLDSAGMKIEQTDAFCVCAGPGSYTGLRVGMSTAKGMAFALNKKLICFGRLQLIAMSFLNELKAAASSIGVLLQARKGEYFWAVFDEEGKEKTAPEHIFETDLASRVMAVQAVITDIEDLQLSEKTIFNLTEEFVPCLEQWLLLAKEKWNSRAFSDIAYAEPFYLKPAFTTVPKRKI